MKKLITVILSLVVTAILLEVSLRAFDSATGRSENRKSWYRLFEQDPFMGYRGRSNVYIAKSNGDEIFHNAEGFRDFRSFSDLSKVDPANLIICVGESSTYGLSAGRQKATYPAMLEKRLRELDPSRGWVVFNAGEPGYSSYEISALIRLRLLKLKPALILDMNVRNDYEFIARSLTDSKDYNFFPLRLAPISRTFVNETLMHSSLYALISYRLAMRFGDDLGGKALPIVHGYPTKRGIEFYRSNLEVAALACAKAHVKFACVDQPVIYDHYQKEDIYGIERIRGELHSFCSSEGVPLLAAHSVINFEGLKLNDDVHLGALGYDRLAQILAPNVLRLLK